ncbi:glycerol-3-phosphate acyltransferase [Synechococcus sp. PCC 6312]|uniref:glycerol-3-phosphate acyltransferase n=1 Tax=Synechococcus sp. (strain ATCC 27167 / PCC 6312) TaxID=195253 RepID=UPI00029ED6D3|nr:glycerol-3-phosphate acyltransferase [Synechococcus sp. PCC 6312]AFY62026.1 phosphoenolpyruvate synthase/pyruvate phosphate dikinase [Synechococcus sp. PCC 6312]
MITQIGLAIVLGLGCSVLGGLPIINGLGLLWLKRPLSQLGTGNAGVSAAFYHGGTVLGILAVCSEAAKGILAVLWMQNWFPDLAVGPWLALLCLVAGRYCWGNGAGTTNVVWGVLWFAPGVAWLTVLVSGVSFTIFRQRQQGRLVALIIFPVMVALIRRSIPETLAAGVLALTLGWIYEELPDDLALNRHQARPESQVMFQFFQGERALLSLDHPLSPEKVGHKAATLSQLKRWGYAVPMGWVLPAGDDPEPLITSLNFDVAHPLVARSSAPGEDSLASAMAGQYASFLDITNPEQLTQALIGVQQSYNRANNPSESDHSNHAGMAVLVQIQIQGVFSGVAFSRDPLWGGLDCVAVETLPGPASRVVSGQFTPESYRVLFDAQGPIPDSLKITGDVPAAVILEVARLCRELETRYHGIPQDLEWTYDGQTIWVLQARPITTLLPIWTRKIAAEVIPGVIHPLTWSINRPLTCGVWGEIFSLVLGQAAQGLDFQATADLHFGRAYFNATLLGTIFRRMGLPPESLEFLTRGAKMSRPPLSTTLKALPGLGKLAQREWQLPRDWQRDDQKHLHPLLQELQEHPITAAADPLWLLNRIEKILTGLEIATYYNIMAPLSAALRQALGRVHPETLDTSTSPETASLKALTTIAQKVQEILKTDVATAPEPLKQALEKMPEGKTVLGDLEKFLQTFGYISPTATDISVPTWQETPDLVWQLLGSLVGQSTSAHRPKFNPKAQAWVQARINLKGDVATVYGQLLANLRWTVLGLENQWLKNGQLLTKGDIFFLQFNELTTAIQAPQTMDWPNYQELIENRRREFNALQNLEPIPYVVYGQNPQLPISVTQQQTSTWQGIGASPGIAQGRVQIIHNPSQALRVPPNTIVVVPYTDAGWLPVLTGAVGIITEVGGRLSHGAIVARELGIPAIMGLEQATQHLKTGQQIQMNGQTGKITLLET